MPWKVRPKKKARLKDGVPVVSVTQPALQVQAVRVNGQPHSHYLYHNSDDHPIAPGNMKGWGRGPKIEEPEWIAGRPEKQNLPACVTRLQPISMKVKLVAETPTAIKGSLQATPTLNGKSGYLNPWEIFFEYPGNAKEHWVEIQTAGQMPDWVGRYLLELAWSVKDPGIRFEGSKKSRIILYCIAGQPYLPAYDSAKPDDPGMKAESQYGTVTGTPKRLDHLMKLLGPKERHPVKTPEDIENLIWQVHCGVNNTPGKPPQFDAGHNVHMTHDGTSSGKEIPEADQWLGWVDAPRISKEPGRFVWNDLSCIGHVQLLKTMLSALGIFIRRSWVYPSTDLLPDGTKVTLQESFLYDLGDEYAFIPDRKDEARFQGRYSTQLTQDGKRYLGKVCLIEPDGGWENFEACAVTPGGRFLPGGYETKSCGESFNRDKGFPSAKVLLQWWCATQRTGFGRRFLCWVTFIRATKELYYWDRNGTRYTRKDHLQIRELGLDLPSP